jgi:hypothetical protein
VDWLATVNNPIALVSVITFLFVSSILVIVKQSAGQTGELVNKFLDRADAQNSKLTDVVTSNTVALEGHSRTNERLADAVERLCQGSK